MEDLLDVSGQQTVLARIESVKVGVDFRFTLLLKIYQLSQNELYVNKINVGSEID